MCVRDLEVCLDPVDLSEGGGGTPLWPARRVCVETLNVSRGPGVGVEVCPAEPPLDLESVCERFGGVSRSCRPRRRRRGNPLVVR